MSSNSEFPDNTSLKEEIANAVTHGIGALIAIAGLVVLVVLTDQSICPCNRQCSIVVFGSWASL